MNLTGWVPVSVAGSSVEWRQLPGHQFVDPFFEDTLRRCAHAPSRRTTLDEALEWTGAHPGMDPSALIFHMSRCGSTLVSQMLAAVEENRVMSEPVPVDHVIAGGDAQHLRAIVGALGQPAEAETRYFVKFDCWHIHQFELIRRTFPQTPAVFLYRDPVEVLVSQMRIPGVWTVSAAGDREQHVAGLLAGILQSALACASEFRLVNYTELPDAVYDLFGIGWSASQIERMRRASRYDAKAPYFEFSGDSAAKRAAASAEVLAAARMLGPLYQRLEVMRRK